MDYGNLKQCNEIADVGNEQYAGICLSGRVKRGRSLVRRNRSSSKADRTSCNSSVRLPPTTHTKAKFLLEYGSILRNLESTIDAVDSWHFRRRTHESKP